uniref:Uncharacterized protein n=1 Tax=Rhizophagus irregularis (strain DAOM 181602 / DAOM 197198 / MUCL 43194) TaxID=747089 RepID=U9UR58_RHIID
MRYFQQNFDKWTSGNDNIDKYIQGSQLTLPHNSPIGVLKWIPYNQFNNIKYISDDRYQANFMKRENQDMIVVLKKLNNLKNVGLEFMYNEATIAYGITQDPKTKYYMKVLDEKCKKCNYACHSIHFQQNFNNWTSGNDDIDKFIQDIQLSSHKYVEKALEWIPYNKFHDITYIMKNEYEANWTNGNIWKWDINNQNWKRKNQNMIVVLKKLNNPKNFKLEFMNEVAITYGITQNPKTKSYMMVLDDKCKKCNYICHSIHFQQNFNNWTSGNDDIDKFIQDIQLSAHNNVKEVLEWIPYNKFYNIKYIADDRYQANWIEGNIIIWNSKNKNWIRKGQNMILVLKKLDNIKDITLEFMNEITTVYGITQNPETKNYIIVLDSKCKKCNNICYSIHFQQNFNNWTSGNDDIDKFIQDIQLSSHDNLRNILEWIPYNKFYDIKYIADDRYQANWIEGNIIDWDSKNKNWKREGQNMILVLKKLDNIKDITLEFINEIKSDEYYGITQDLETKGYFMVILSNKCIKCNIVCCSMYFQQNFNNWASGNDDIDKFIQNIQLSAHTNVSSKLD